MLGRQGRLLFGLMGCLSLLFFLSPSSFAEPAGGIPVKVGFDGAFGLKQATSAQAIELGIRVAIHEINASGGVLNGRPLELVVKDNRSVPARGVANLRAFAAMPDLVAVVVGRFSPVVLQQVDVVHQLEIPTLDVWAAADGITDHDHAPNYIFRLSLKDSQAMPLMIEHLLRKGKKRVGVLLPNTGWGRSNNQVLLSVAAKYPELQIVDVSWYNWGEKDMAIYYENLLRMGAEGLILVANDIEGSLLVRQVSENLALPRIPIASHWGVTGGDMFGSSGPGLAAMDFTVVQTFSFFKVAPDRLAKFMKSVGQVSGITTIEQFDSPVGVGHAYDMTHILAKAINLAGSVDRAAVRDALESGFSHRGLVRNYDRVFTKGSHDALPREQVFMARYREDGVIVPVDP